MRRTRSLISAAIRLRPRPWLVPVLSTSHSSAIARHVVHTGFKARAALSRCASMVGGGPGWPRGGEAVDDDFAAVGGYRAGQRVRPQERDVACGDQRAVRANALRLLQPGRGGDDALAQFWH